MVTLEATNSQQFPVARLLILAAWAIYAAGLLVSLVLYPPSQPTIVFGIVAALGVASAVGAQRGTARWPLWVGATALLFLFLSLLRHVYYVTLLMDANPSALEAVRHYLVVSLLVIRKDIEQNSLFALFTYTYHEWLMPVLQLAILVFVLRVWLQMRSNRSMQPTAESGG